MMDKKNTFFFLFVFIFLTVIRMIFSVPIAVWEEHDIALNLINEGEFYYRSDGAKYHAFQFPAYTFCLAIIYSLFGVQLFAVIIFNILIHVLTAYLFLSLFKLLVDYLYPFMQKKYKERIIFISLIMSIVAVILVFYNLFF